MNMVNNHKTSFYANQRRTEREEEEVEKKENLKLQVA